MECANGRTTEQQRPDGILIKASARRSLPGDQRQQDHGNLIFVGPAASNSRRFARVRASSALNLSRLAGNGSRYREGDTTFIFGLATGEGGAYDESFFGVLKGKQLGDIGAVCM